MIERFIRRPEVETITGLSRSSIYAMIARGDFPAPVKIGMRAAAWPANEVASWIEARIHARDADKPPAAT